MIGVSRSMDCFSADLQNKQYTHDKAWADLKRRIQAVVPNDYQQESVA